MQEAIKIREQDNVAVALQFLFAGQKVSVGLDVITLVQDIAMGHKFALTYLETDHDVIKYGYSIGKAIRPIQKGEWVHTHNLKTGLGEVLNYQYQPLFRAEEGNGKIETRNEKIETGKADIETGKENIEIGQDKIGKNKIATIDAPNEEANFYGYRRKNGTVGIRNEIWIIPTVGCVNNIARLLEKVGKEYLTEEIEELVAFTHPYGCSQLGDDQLNTQKILSGLINHPNAAGVLVLGLGCENNNVDEMKRQIESYSEERVKFLVCQECEDELEEGIKLIKELIHYASEFKREKVNAKELIIGLKCGGSDGLSGITANPVVGAFSDRFLATGGTTILTEVPEMFGAETILMNRCANETLFHQTVSLINDFKQYFIDNKQPIYENPSPGNKQGGISTLEDKSLGCTQKSGSSQVMGVLRYGEPVKSRGLLLLSSPGNDLVASTALAASGAHIILFTTGRGTPFGAPVPTLKISSNTALATRKKGWIDFDAGQLLVGRSLSSLSEELLTLILDTASGKKVMSEENGYRDLAIFKQGVTL